MSRELTELHSNNANMNNLSQYCLKGPKYRFETKEEIERYLLNLQSQRMEIKEKYYWHNIGSTFKGQGELKEIATYG